jgi:hypothetical protein
MSGAASIGPFSLSTASAKEAVLISNTPSFLLDRLRKDVAVQTVLDSMTSDQIVTSLKATLAGEPMSPGQLVPAYIFLAALSGADPQDAKLWEEISSIDLSGLEWGDTIRSVILAEAVPTFSFEISVCRQTAK